MYKTQLVFLIMGLCSLAFGAPTWPVVWDAIPGAPGGYIDALSGNINKGDNVYATASPAQMNIVGDGTYAAGFWSVSSDDIMFRVRVDGDPDGGGRAPFSQHVWTALLNLDGDSQIDYAMQLDHSGHYIVELVEAISGGPADSWQSVVLSETNLLVGDVATYARHSATGDGSLFNGDTDYFVDFALDLDGFKQQTSWDGNSKLGIAFSTSTSHSLANKDLPDGDWGGDPVSIPIPVPGAMLLGSVGVCIVGWSRKRSVL